MSALTTTVRGWFDKLPTPGAKMRALRTFTGPVRPRPPSIWAKDLFERVVWRNPKDVEHSWQYINRPLLNEAWNMPNARKYGSIGLTSQKAPPYCAFGSADNVLRSMGVKGLSQDLLVARSGISEEQIVKQGLSLDMLADVIRLQGRKRTTVLRDQTLPEFRAQLRTVNDGDHRLIANFDRRGMFSFGGGHFSPIGAYLPKQDLVLILDTNPSSPAFLIKAERLWRAMQGADSQSGRSRGLLRVDP